MAHTEYFPVPRYMQPADVAKALSAYLQGPLAFENSLDHRGEYRNGPYRMNGSENDWQLDTTNDFWLHVRGNTMSVGCRYPGEEAVLNAIVTLFKLRFAREPRATVAPLPQPRPSPQPQAEPSVVQFPADVDGEEEDLRASRDMTPRT